MKTFYVILAIFSLLLLSILCASEVNALCVKVSRANLRTGPGTGYEIGWNVGKYMPFKKVGVSLSGHWYAVEDVDGAVLWIHKSLVTSQYRCAVVKKEKVNVRTGPGTNYDKLFLNPVEQYYSARILTRKGSWIKDNCELL